MNMWIDELSAELKRFVTADPTAYIDDPTYIYWGPPLFEITGLRKADGPLTKRIGLSADGALVSDGSACVMPRGVACRVTCDTLEEFADGVAGLRSDQAIALGALRDDLPGEVAITAKARLNGVAGFAVVARTAENIIYRPGQPALALLDLDFKGMPAATREKIDAAGGSWAALVSVLPELAQTAHVVRASTSSGLSVNKKPLAGSNGQHIYLLIKNGADAERFLNTFHERCWLHGFGWQLVGAAGQLLERSVIDRAVGRSERLVFEGAPVLDAPLVQADRRPTVTEGETLDTLTACPPLTVLETTKLRDLRAKGKHRLAAELAAARERFITAQAARIVERTGSTLIAARRTIEKLCDGVLLSDVALPFDAPELAGMTVGAVLADPEKFIGETLADPLEGGAYGANKAVVMRRADGAVWIYSFAHGRTDYELRHSAAAVEAILRETADADLIATFVRLAPGLDAHERQRMRDTVFKRTGVGVRAIDQAVKAERKRAESRREEADAERRAAERTDPRPQIDAPPDDAPWLPQMEVINDVLGASAETEPPARDIEGVTTRLKMRRIPLLHLLQSEDDDDDAKSSYLPAPEQLCLVRTSEEETAEMIERHIDYIGKGGRSVHLPTQFVRHFMKRDDDVLPTVVAIAQLPIVLPNGDILAKRGLDRNRGIIIRVPGELMKLLPKRENYTAVADAMRFYATYGCVTWRRITPASAY